MRPLDLLSRGLLPALRRPQGWVDLLNSLNACLPADEDDEDNLVDFARKKWEQAEAEPPAAKEGKRAKREQEEKEEGKGERLSKGHVSGYALHW